MHTEAGHTLFPLARYALEKTLANTGRHLKAKIEIINVHLLFRVIRKSCYATVLSESTVVDEKGLVAVFRSKKKTSGMATYTEETHTWQGKKRRS